MMPPHLLPLLADDEGQILEDLVHLTHRMHMALAVEAKQRRPHLFNLLYALLTLRNHRIVEFEVARNLSREV